MDRSPARDVAVGLFVLAGLGAIAYLSFTIGGFGRGAGGLSLNAGFNEIAGLNVHSPVKIAGVRVGEVSEITLNQLDHFRARVKMDLDPALKLSVDTRALIYTDGMLGGRYVQLEPGGDDRLLKNGDTIAITNEAMVLEKEIGKIELGLTNSGAKSK